MDVTCDTKKEIIISTLNINVSFFDCDCVLVDSELICCQVLVEMAKSTYSSCFKTANLPLSHPCTSRYSSLDPFSVST